MEAQWPTFALSSRGGQMTTRVKVGTRYQVTLPAAVREQLTIAPGDQLLVTVRDGYLLLIPEPRDYVATLHGLHREHWTGINTEEYLERERSAWPT
jgi:AbrB family looped-hinge helix DNA binding protein